MCEGWEVNEGSGRARGKGKDCRGKGKECREKGREYSGLGVLPLVVSKAV